jgi:DNA primase
MFDGDGAGQKAALKNTDLVLKEGMNVRVLLLPAEHDPDTFARAYSAEEVREYIAKNSQDFISFKAKLLLADAQNDPIRRSEVTKSMVESIALVQDNIQRSFYIKECAQLMGVDPNMLIGEVARKRVMAKGDKQAEEFVRREHRRRWQERKSEEQRPSEDNIHFGHISVGSSEESLEREIIYYLLAHGDKEFDFKEGRDIVAINVADLIISELSEDDFGFTNEAYDTIYKHYHALREKGSYPDPQEYISHSNPDVCNAAVDVMTIDETYAESELWTKKEVHITSESEVLGEGVPKVIQLFKTKRLTLMIESLQKRLNDENLSEEEFMDIMSRLVTLNRAKVMLTKQVNRLTI